MKRLFALILACVLLFALSAEAFADEPVRLAGQFAEEEVIRTRQPAGTVNPFYLDKPVTKCKHVKLTLSVDQENGDCEGNYYIYAKDFDDHWDHIGTFKLKANKINGKEYSYEIDLDGRQDFCAVALWPAEKVMSCEGYYKYSVYVDPGCVSEYSDKYPEPVFEPSNVTEQYISLGFSMDGYVNPYSAGATAWFFSHY